MVINTGDMTPEVTQDQINESDGFASRAIEAIKTHSRTMLLSLWIWVGSVAVATAEEVRVAGLSQDSIILAHSQENSGEIEVPTSIPDQITITNARGESFEPSEYGIAPETAVSFLNAAQSLRASQVEEFSQRFLELSPEDMAMVIMAYGAANNGEIDERGVQRLVRGVIMFMDIRENVAFVAENGYIRQDAEGERESTNILRFAENLVDDYPQITLVLTPEYMQETQALYRTGIERIRERRSEMEWNISEMEWNISEMEWNISEMEWNISEMEQRIIEMDALISRMQTLVLASNTN